MPDLSLTDSPYPPPSDNRTRWMMAAVPRVAAARIVREVLEARAGERGYEQVHRDDVECAAPFSYGVCDREHLTARRVPSPDPVSVAARAELAYRRRRELDAFVTAGRGVRDTVAAALAPFAALGRTLRAAAESDLARLERRALEGFGNGPEVTP